MSRSEQSADEKRPHSGLAPIVRFVLVGCVNTAVSWVVYWVLLGSFGYGAAYAAGFLAGNVCGYLLNAGFTFGTRYSFRKYGFYLLAYIGLFAIGRIMMEVLVAGELVDARWAIILVTVVMIPISYVVVRRILTSVD